jgi:sugar phosphate permease
MSQTSVSSKASGGSSTLKPATSYRWVVMAVIFITYAINFADRTNIGVALPFISKDFHLTNFEAGALASMFFLGYAVSQIPAGFWFSKFGTRGLVSLSIFGFSFFTYLIGGAGSALGIKWARFGLGLAEGPTPVGCTSTVNNWFPPKEKATATGIYIASTMFAPILVPPLCVWIALTYGWRYIFYCFSIPGILMAFIWYVFVRNRPEESKFVSESELTYIRDKSTNGQVSTEGKSLGALDKFIRAKKVKLIETRGGVFASWNVWGDCLAYFLMVSVLYGLLTWIPSYLVREKHFSFMKMGVVAAAPWIGGFLGSIVGGWLSDKVLLKRRKPTMLFTALFTAFMMVILTQLPQSVPLTSLALFMTGFLLNVGWPAFTAYPMGLATGSTYPIAIALVNSGGNLGGFFSPMIAGLLLDSFKSFTFVFCYFGVAALLGFFVILTLDEPVQ